MKLENKKARDYIAYDVVLKANSVQEVTNKEAIKILLNQEGVTEYADIQKQKELQAENEALKKQVELAKAKEEAIALGISFNPNIGLEKLLSKIETEKEKQHPIEQTEPDEQ